MTAPARLAVGHATATALVLVAVLGARVAAQTPGLEIAVSARAISPGELMLVTISVPGGATARVDVSALGRNARGVDLGDGRWQALIGIDIDQRPGPYVVTADAYLSGTVLHAVHDVIVQPHAFPTRRLQVDPEFVNPPPQTLARIRREDALIQSAYAISAPDRLWSAPFERPVPGRANSRFGSRSIFNGEARRPHGGTDFLSPAGTPIKAPNAGKVVLARELYFTGNTVIIDHGLGAFSMLAHLSRLDVGEGDLVTAGQHVGLVGATGRVTGAHLHWGFTVAGARVDPLSVLALLGTP